MREFKCENGWTYLCPDKSCLFCGHCDCILWDYTNGPYMVFCAVGDPDEGAEGKCEFFTEEVVKGEVL